MGVLNIWVIAHGEFQLIALQLLHFAMTFEVAPLCQSGVWKKASGDSGKILSPTIPTTFFPAWTACASGTASTRRFYITAAGQLYATSGCNYSLLFNICNLASGSCTGPDPLSTCYTWGMTAKYSLTPAGLLIINSNSYVDGWGTNISCGTVFPPWES